MKTVKELLFNQNINYIECVKSIDCKNLFSDGLIYFKPVTCDKDLIYCFLDYQLDKEQKEMVNAPGISISRAYTNPLKYYPFIICDQEDNNIGFICLCKWIGKGDAFSFTSFFIDKRYQKRGYGTASIKLAIKLLKAVDNKPIKVAVGQDNKKAQDVYFKLGFIKTDELDGDDFVFAI